jgi:osmotically-inducible protein OsmY
MDESQQADAEIQDGVIEELQWDALVRRTDIGVDVRSGVVTLTGTVDSWAARHAAQQAAHRVRGVRDVANDIRIELPGSHVRDDAAIARAARRALESDVLVPHERIQTTVSNGVVTLEGTVGLWAQRDDAERCIRNLTGVSRVDCRISVEPTLHVSERSLQLAIEGALMRHAEHAAKKVRVVVSEGEAVLRGTVRSWAERAAIEGAVRGTPGIRDVKNEIGIQT